MKIVELRKKNAKQLREELIALRKKQLGLRFERTNKTLKSSADFRKTRRSIAQVKTLLTELQVTAS